MAETVPGVGEPAPAFGSMTDTGESMSLADYAGKSNVVLYFYPRADTPGCTLEAKGFRDAFQSFKDAGAVILGVSPDTVKKQSKFSTKYELPFPLLADDEHKVAEIYGVWKEKSFMGRKYMGVDRVTFVIDKEGIIRSVFPKVNIVTHAADVLKAVKSLS